ncbi:hypothetical protein [Paraburkholderia sp. SUR17]|uniref:hypothetical protein n=1 Tax=Paraburkholderia sp. SUR17 TaxID=3034358 RepID=UPI0024078263|nr:hypothetical protein [Paraburkholderia sp. SUR17]WEY37721.1 hypothetical protein P2869_11595 [Paraburkholderia sp. SUR17]
MTPVIAPLRQLWAALCRAKQRQLPTYCYADLLVRHEPERFNAIEVHGARQRTDPDDPLWSWCEIDRDAPALFSVFLRCADGHLVCCADPTTHADALHCAQVVGRRYGWPVHDGNTTQTRRGR